MRSFSFVLAAAGLCAVSSLGAQPLIHPAFTFTAETFAPVAQAIPDPFRAAVLSSPKAFLEAYRPLLNQPADLLVLVDKKNELPDDYEPVDLVVLKAPAFVVNKKGMQFRKAYLPALTALVKAAKKEKLTLTVSSAYRSWVSQKNLFQGYVNKDGLATAERYSARPGRSQHQLGTVVDFGVLTPEFADMPEGQWLAEHAGEFGFSMSFPDGQESLTGYVFEPWHFRYLGVEACAVQRLWFGGLQQRLIEFHAGQAAVLRAAVKK